MQTDTRKLTNLAILSAIAFAVMAVGRIPIVLFLKYDPKDVIITLGGLIYGPMSAMLITTVVCLIEMLTVSDTGFIGLVMNILSSCAFACTASYIYKKKPHISGAVIGLASGCLLATAVMLLWNYLITPIYMGYPRAAVAAMLVPVFLPFNLLKGSLNAAFTMIIYKPLVRALRKADLIPPSTADTDSQESKQRGVLLVSFVVLVTCILLVLVMQGKI